MSIFQLKDDEQEGENDLVVADKERNTRTGSAVVGAFVGGVVLLILVANKFETGDATWIAAAAGIVVYFANQMTNNDK